LGKEHLIRFIVGPDDRVVPDLKGDLPGRGMWVRAEREAIQQAVAKGRFSRGARRNVNAPEGLADQVERLLSRRCLDLLGLAKKAGALVHGFDRVAAALEGKKAHLLLAARDGAVDGRAKLERKAGQVPVVALFDRAELSLALGAENVVHAALTDARLARRFLEESGRLKGFRPTQA
jgi:predicted RNA-binding protein YlxR (DUF448 family)